MVVRDCSYFYIVGRFYPNNRITFMSRNINEDDFIINTNNVIVVKIQLYLSNYHKYLTICLMVDPTKKGSPFKLSAVQTDSVSHFCGYC